jgi:hypothetical protein
VRDEELLSLELTLVRPVLSEVVTEVERLLLVVPSVYRGDEELRPEEDVTDEDLSEEPADEDVLPGELLLRDDERPEDE